MTDAPPSVPEPPAPRSGSRRRIRPPLWLKALVLAAVLAVVALLMSSPGTAAVAGGCALVGAAIAALPVALPRRASDAIAEGSLGGLRASSSRAVSRVGRRYRRTRRRVRFNARAAGRELGERGETAPAVALVVVSLALWGAIALLLLTR